MQILYRRSYDGILLRCLSHKEEHEAFKEAHDGMCGAHQPGPKLGDWLRRLGYYWLKMIPNAIAYARRCLACQIHGDFVHQVLGCLHPTSSSWPFEMWGMDVIGSISPPTSRGHRFIFVITDYFSKWSEVVPLKEVKTPNWSSLSSIMYFITSVYPDESSTIIGLNSSAKHSDDSVTNSESKLCHQWHTIHPPMAL